MHRDEPLDQTEHGVEYEDAEFIALLDGAIVATLVPREVEIFRLRFGLTGGVSLTWKEVGQEIGVSGERVRQILNRSLRRLRGAGNRQIKLGHPESPAGKLLSYLQVLFVPGANDAPKRLVSLADNLLPHLPTVTHAILLLANLAISDKRLRDEAIARAKEIHRERAVPVRHSKAQSKQSVVFDHLVMQVVWPANVTLWSIDAVHGFKRQRDVSLDGKGRAGNFYSEKLRRMVQYESQLEMRFLARLEELDQVVFYQEQPCAISYRSGTQERLYYPDVLLSLQDGRILIVEVKPVFQMALHDNIAKWDVLKVYSDREGFGTMVTDGRLTLQQIYQHSIKPGYEEAVLEEVEHGPISWQKYLSIRDHFQPGRRDFAAVIIQNRLVWRLGPFVLCCSD